MYSIKIGLKQVISIVFNYEKSHASTSINSYRVAVAWNKSLQWSGIDSALIYDRKDLYLDTNYNTNAKKIWDYIFQYTGRLISWEEKYIDL